MRNELYLYWRAALADLQAASRAIRAFQHEQSVACPGLQARLLRRADAPGGLVTVMETYALPDSPIGIPDTLRQRIVESGDAASAPWRAGPRHLETFSEITAPKDRIDGA